MSLITTVAALVKQVESVIEHSLFELLPRVHAADPHPGVFTEFSCNTLGLALPSGPLSLGGGVA